VSGGEQSGPSEPWKNVSGSAIPEADGGSQATIFDIESQSNLPERRTQS
jgi:hypothetical protein